MIENPDISEIPLPVVEAGIALLDYYLTETLRLHACGVCAPDIALAEKLLAWLHSSPGNHVHLTQVYQRGPYGIRDAETARRVLGILEKHRWLIRIEDGMTLGGKHRKDVWGVIRKEAQK
jgi:hypothetical protein